MKGPRPFGFRREGERLVPDPDESIVRRAMFELFLKHGRVKTVARLLNFANHRTRRGAPFSDTSVLRMLRDRSALDGIVERGTWERCQALLAERSDGANRPNRRSAHHLGEVVECACGGGMRLRGEGSGAKFICRSCRAKVPALTLDRLVRESFRDADSGMVGAEDPFQDLYSVWPSLGDDAKREFVDLLVARVVVGNDVVTVGLRVSRSSCLVNEAAEVETLPSRLDLPSSGKGSTKRGNELPEGAPLLSVDEAARLLRTTPRAVYVMAGRGTLPGVTRIGRRLLVRREDLVRSLDESRAPSPTEDRR